MFVKYRPTGGPGGGPVAAASPYLGPDRGVLVTLGTDQVGHLPLGLLDEERAGPPPPL